MSDAEDFTIYARGLVHISVCSSLEREQVEARANLEYPSGVHPWVVSEEPTFKGGEPNPCPCHDHPETHKHWLLRC